MSDPYRVVTLGPNSYTWACPTCSALVDDREQHNQWHTDRSPDDGWGTCQHCGCATDGGRTTCSDCYNKS